MNIIQKNDLNEILKIIIKTISKTRNDIFSKLNNDEIETKFSIFIEEKNKQLSMKPNKLFDKYILLDRSPLVRVLISNFSHSITHLIGYSLEYNPEIQIEIYKKILSYIFLPILKNMVKQKDQTNKFIFLNHTNLNVDVRFLLLDIYNNFFLTINSSLNDAKIYWEQIFIENSVYYNDFVIFTNDLILNQFTTLNTNNKPLLGIKGPLIDAEYDLIYEFFQDKQIFNKMTPKLFIFLLKMVSFFNNNIATTNQYKKIIKFTNTNIDEYIMEWNNILLTSNNESLKFDLIELKLMGEKKLYHFLKNIENDENKILSFINSNVNLSRIFQLLIRETLNKEVFNLNDEYLKRILLIFLGYLVKKEKNDLLNFILKILSNEFNAKKSTEDLDVFKKNLEKKTVPKGIWNNIKIFLSNDLLKDLEWIDIQDNNSITNKIDDFYTNIFIKKLVSFLQKFYKDFNTKNINTDLRKEMNFYRNIIFFLEHNYDPQKINFDDDRWNNFFYTWVYMHEMNGFYKKTNEENIWQLEDIKKHCIDKSIIHSYYDAKKILNLAQKYLNIKDVDISKIDPRVFVDNNLLSTEDRIFFNSQEYIGDSIYCIIIEHLKLNAEIEYGNNIDYYSSTFQEQLCKSLKIEEIIQSNDLHIIDRGKFSNADYFEALLSQIYNNFGYKIIYQMIRNLFFLNQKDCLINSDQKSFVDDEDDFFKKYLSKSKRLEFFLQIPKMFYLHHVKSLNFSNNASLDYYGLFKKHILKIILKSFNLISEYHIQSNSHQYNQFLNFTTSFSTYRMDQFIFYKLFYILEEEGLEELLKELESVISNEN